MSPFARSRARRIARLAGGFAAALALCATLSLLLAQGCRSTRGPSVEVRPVPAEAAAAFEEARAWARGSLPALEAETLPDQPQLEEGDTRRARDRALAAARRAHRLAPDWIAPRRMVDDYLRTDLLGIEALAAYRRELELAPDDARLQYLAGRLEGEGGTARFARAVALEPGLAWGYHGLAHVAASRGEWKEALRQQRLALERARDSFERSYFSAALARYEVSAERPERALEVLLGRLAAEDVAPVDAVELAVQTALIELAMPFKPHSRRGYERALELLRQHELTDDEIRQLVQRLRQYRRSDGSGSLELQLALAARPGRARDRLRAELLLDTRSTPLALGLLQRSRATHRDSTAGPLLRAARFAAGQFALAVEEWLADLPQAVLDAQGRPRDVTLRAIVDCARALPPAPSEAQLAELGERLLAAGWFREARSVASVLAAHDLDQALRLEDQAAAGQELLAAVRRLMQSLDEEDGAAQALALGTAGGSLEPTFLSETPGPAQQNLRGVLAALAPLAARAQPLLGHATHEQALARELERSPLLEYGSIGALVHPGPWFSEADQARGLGRAGEPVPGLAALLARLGRFGIFGEVLGGGGPDGTLLQRVLAEPRSGEHLGVPWSGAVVWCEGTDLRSRAGRRGANISGAALHEGYWVDFDALRRERDAWALFQEEFFGSGDADRVQRALASRGLELTTPRADRQRRRIERRSAAMLLGEADRVRLAVLRDRAAQRARSGTLEPGGGELVGLDELVHTTAVHEEGHLCDRARFLPLARNWGRALRLLAACSFSPSNVARRLEYRAELTALCEVPDPRVVLVSILRAVESGGSGVTPHGDAYRDLLDDLLATLDRELARHPARWPELSPDHVLAHQLHWLPPERLRTVARMQARKEGLLR